MQTLIPDQQTQLLLWSQSASVSHSLAHIRSETLLDSYKALSIWSASFGMRPLDAVQAFWTTQTPPDLLSCKFTNHTGVVVHIGRIIYVQDECSDELPGKF
jgi:hypothetical protein